MAAVLKDPAALPAPAPIHQLHHYAYRARDAEETRHFYEDILGLPLYHIIQSDVVPSTGEYCPYTHFFFRLQDGSFIAFFDLGNDEAALPSPNTPLWVNHISFRVDSVQALKDMKARLEAHGIEVLGITDHHIFDSIYFFDPNGVRLELTAQRADEFQMLQESRTAHARLREWTARKEQWRKRPRRGQGGPGTEAPAERPPGIRRKKITTANRRMPSSYAQDLLQQRLRIHPGQRLRAAGIPVCRAARNRHRQAWPQPHRHRRRRHHRADAGLRAGQPGRSRRAAGRRQHRGREGCLVARHLLHAEARWRSFTDWACTNPSPPRASSGA
jgi:glyoxylase I family protein